MLYSSSNLEPTSSNKPVVVLLHGLLGSGSDWQVMQQSCDFPVITIDLPGHGMSSLTSCSGFRDCCDQISDTLLNQIAPHQPIVLVGYSMGARIVMSGVANGNFAHLNIKLLIAEGGNFGLATEEQRSLRLAHDQHWAKRFNEQPIEQVLSDWYQQPVFSSLNYEQRQKMVAKRSANLGAAVANMLMATSLGKQHYLLDALKASGIATHYVCGEQDNKFSQLAKQSGLSFSQVAQAGHNVHVEQPEAFATIVNTQINHHLLKA